MKLSLRTKTIIVWLCTLLALALGLSAITVLTLSLLKARLVESAVDLAQEQVEALRDDVRDILAKEGAATSQQIKNSIEARKRTEVFLKDHGQITSVIILDDHGDKVFQYGPGPAPEIEIKRVKVPGEITKPIMIGDRKIGDLTAMLSESKVLRGIQTTSSQMMWAMSTFLVAMIVILAAVFLLLWRMFLRHIDLLSSQDQMERMAYVGTLASGLAHEIRNPLNAMGLNLQIVEEDLADPRPESAGRTRSIARTLHAQIDQLNTTLGNFLSFAIPRGREAKEFDLCELLHSVNELLLPEIESRGVEWIEEAPETVMLRGEPAMFQEVIVNIVLNALHAMETIQGPRRLIVTLKVDGKCAALEIADTGPGIAPQDLGKIFEAFYSTRDGGSGFGLAIASRIVHDHGGTLVARNRSEGGAAFLITVPRSAD
jgi:signal transduction histidine kinase